MISAFDSANQVWALVCGLPPGKRERRLIMVLKAFFDGSTEAGEALIFAGYMASVETWAKFSEDWSELLAVSPSINPPFKMKSFSRNLDRAEIQYQAIARAGLAGIGCAIPIRPLVKVADEIGLPKKWKNPYYLAWRIIITEAIRGANILGSQEPIEFIFDDQNDKVRIIESWDRYYQSMPGDIRERVRGIPGFKKDDDLAPLQAADLIAWWGRKQYLKDKSRMKDLFPGKWTNYKDPTLLFSPLSESVIRDILHHDIEMFNNGNRSGVSA
jgi:hypothetical protein